MSTTYVHRYYLLITIAITYIATLFLASCSLPSTKSPHVSGPEAEKYSYTDALGSSTQLGNAASVVNRATNIHSRHEAIALGKKGAIAGQCFLSDELNTDRPCSNLLLLLLDSSNQEAATSVTNDNGDFSFDLPPQNGRFKIVPRSQHYIAIPESYVSAGAKVELHLNVRHQMAPATIETQSQRPKD